MLLIGLIKFQVSMFYLMDMVMDMDDIDACIGAECKVLDRVRLGWRHVKRVKGVSLEEHCSFDQEPADEYFEED